MKKRLNPYKQNQYGTGGSIGGLIGGIAGTAIGGPMGAAIGSKLGSAVGGSFDEDPQEAMLEQQRLAMQKQAQSDYDSGVASAKMASYSQNINEPINPATQGYAYGGMFNSTAVNEYNGGGTHEENPLGGIPQGTGPNGKMNTVEEGEVSIKIDSKNKYVFSNRLIYQ